MFFRTFSERGLDRLWRHNHWQTNVVLWMIGCARVFLAGDKDGMLLRPPSLINWPFSSLLTLSHPHAHLKRFDCPCKFTCPHSHSGVIGNDPVALLQSALSRAGVSCTCTALLNDGVGLLVAQRYLDPCTTAGIIVGTGTNACYVEKVWPCP